MARSPISRVGGKFYSASKIISLFPEHSRYIEPFGGAMHVLYKKEPSAFELYNDIDGNLVNFFNVVKHNPEELIDKLDLLLYSRKMFLQAKANLATGTDIERACNFYIVNRQCFGGKMKEWGITTSGSHGFFKYDERIREAHERLKNVYIENLDFRKLIAKYDSPESLFYLDPPYMFNENRSKHRVYEHEMADGDHAELIEILKNIKGKFILSGYRNSLYDCFERVPMGKMCIMINKKAGEPRIKKEEFAWKNF